MAIDRPLIPGLKPKLIHGKPTALRRHRPRALIDLCPLQPFETGEKSQARKQLLQDCDEQERAYHGVIEEENGKLC